MAQKMVRVEQLGQTYVVDGESYGPSSEPLDIPEVLANMLGASPYPGPADADQGLAGGDNADESPDALRAQLAQLQSANESLEKERDGLQAQINGLTDARAQADTRLQEAEQQQRTAKGGLDSLKGTVETLTAERDRLAGELARVTQDRDSLRENSGGGGNLPTDIRARLVAIDGVGEKLADKIASALQSE